MNPATQATDVRGSVLPAAPPAARPGGASRWESFPGVALILAALLAAFALLPQLRANPRVVWSLLGGAAGLAVWDLVLAAAGRRKGLQYRIEFVPIRSHWVQACVQFSILVYWGWYEAAVGQEAPLIAAQVVYLYALDALLSWSRGRVWRVGFGPLPIIFSTNLLLWFRDDWFYLQLLMILTGALGKHFVTWMREGRRTHIFNPSVFGQFLFALVLIYTGTTERLTFGKEIAATFENPPFIFLWIFLVGLLVQSLFQVTLMTLAAGASLFALNAAYHHATGGYWFISTNLGATVFLGMHLLITDPATSPRTNLGRVIFGAMYGVGYFVLFRVLDDHGVPLFWDKLLPVPILNLSVPLLDRVSRSGLLGRFNRWWETALSPARMNLVHMGCWTALCLSLIGTGYIEAPHEGGTIEFWQKAYDQGVPRADRNLFKTTAYLASQGSAVAYNHLGVLYMEGKVVATNHAAAANCFQKACELGDPEGCANEVRQFLSLGEAASNEAALHALDILEHRAVEAKDGASCFLVGVAYETGRGRTRDLAKALGFYLRACDFGAREACDALARLGASPSKDAHGQR